MSTPANSLDISVAGIVRFDGTATFSADTVTQHNVLVGGASNAITSIAPSATTGVALVSQGAAADPAFSTVVVAGGGTGDTSFTAYSVICGGTTSTGALQNVSGLGSSGNVLTSNGAGALPTWQAAASSGFTTVAIQTFTVTGTYTPTASMKYCIIECLGGGGAGGGSPGTAGSSAAGGGGAGEYARGVFSAATIGASKSVTIGAAGTGASNSVGGNGGNTSVGSTLISANGGTGGAIGGNGNNQTAQGGLGGTGGTGGSFRTPGQVGFPAFGASVAVPIFMPGIGGSSQYGAGGQGQVNGNGSAGLGYGAGGGGGQDEGGNTNRTGGNGSAGIVIITEFI